MCNEAKGWTGGQKFGYDRYSLWAEGASERGREGERRRGSERGREDSLCSWGVFDNEFSRQPLGDIAYTNAFMRICLYFSIGVQAGDLAPLCRTSTFTNIKPSEKYIRPPGAISARYNQGKRVWSGGKDVHAEILSASRYFAVQSSRQVLQL